MNEPEAIRTGEELDVLKLGEYLRSRLPTPFDKIEVLQFTAGSSNLTYLIRLGSTEYVLRRPPFGNTVRSAHDMEREYDVLSRLGIVYPPAPEPLLFCGETDVIGSEFYLMERREGLILRGDASSPQVSNGPAPHGHPSRDLNTSQPYREQICRAFMRNLADLHSVDYVAAGLEDLGRPEGYCRRQVEGWSKRYFAAKTHIHPELDSTIGWLNENIPSESGAALLHNDYKFDNIMLDPDDLTEIVAVLDWEMVTVGDPLMDLGTALGYWMSPDAGEEMMNQPFNPRVLMENISRQELADMYANESGRDIANILYYYVFGTFKIAAIAQQIFSRYAKGWTKDTRFANFDRFVAALGTIAETAIKRGSI